MSACECMKEDVKHCGEAYYHTCHQLPGVRVCPIHGCHLMKIKNRENGILNGSEWPRWKKKAVCSLEAWS